LTEKFAETTDRNRQVQFLTLLPKRWSVKQIQKEFTVSTYMARKVKDHVKEQGILSSPNPKHGCTLPLVIVSLVQDFYESDEISRIMPGNKDFVSIKHCDK